MMMASGTSQVKAENISALHVKEYKLQNGLTVWLNEDHSQPKVFGAVVVKAGAKDSPNTGIAHYFEHMMFKGTDKIGTVDYESEKALLDLISDKYDALATTENPKERTHLLKIINDLSVRAADYVIPNEFNRLITQYGGSGLNAATSYDATVYFNTFSPQYMEQWAEINSERLLNPVFRLFQSELETVYEEKNMYGDFIGRQVMDTLLSRYFAPHPYAYPIIGSTKYLKNPSLKEMQKFFEKYYVAPNMALILSGDFDTESVIPIIDKTFSRVRTGDMPKRATVTLPPFNGKEKMKVKFPIPFMKGLALGFRGVPANHEDLVALNIAVNLLNNANGTGFLDKLMVDRKLVGAMALNQSMNDAGILAVAAMPKPIIQSYSSAEKMIWKEIDRVKKGDFDGELFSSLKLEQKRMTLSALEDIDSRSRVLMDLFSQGKDWDTYVKYISEIESITKEDVMRVAKKYFSKNYLCVTKSTGKYPKDELPKPDFAPVVPQHMEAASDYARKLEEIPVQEVKPRRLDFENDVQTMRLTPNVTLYAAPNPVNDIFSLEVSYRIGYLEESALVPLAVYLQYLGTDNLTFEQFRTHLQAIGSTVTFEATHDNFILKIVGFDNHIEETLELASGFISHVKADNKKMKPVVDEAEIAHKSFFKSSDNIAYALLEKVKFGDKSFYLKKIPYRQLKKMKGKALLDTFHKVRRMACDIHYCGTLPADKVSELLWQNFPLEDVDIPVVLPYSRKLKTYDKPTVFFFNMPTAVQSVVYGYVKGDQVDDSYSRHVAPLFSAYFGGDMSSLLFQEIREFRSLAYRTSARFKLPSKIHTGYEGCLDAMLSTQADKTVEAMGVLDSLIREMPLKPERMETLKQTLVNQFNNDYPSFRNLSGRIANLHINGFEYDPVEELLEDIDKMNMQDIAGFYQKQISGRPVIYMVVGNAKRIDMEQLSKFGTIVKLERKDIYN